jgi:5-methylcytosine-specific restriction endonuclease McrA
MDNGRPDWRSQGLGLRVRIALWLASEVGEGGQFSIRDLQNAFGEAGDYTRRLRDLRSAGWVFETPHDNPQLGRDLRRLVKQGSPVWDPKHRADGLRLLTKSLRQTVLHRDNYRCVRCGVGAGETYPDDPRRAATLVVNHLVPLAAGGTGTEDNLVTECTLCSHSGSVDTPIAATTDDVWRQLSDLPERDQARVLAWLVKGRKEHNRVEAAFVAAWRLPPDERAALMSRLADAVAG